MDTIGSASYQLATKLALVMERNELQFGKTVDEICVEFHLEIFWKMILKCGLLN